MATIHGLIRYLGSWFRLLAFLLLPFIFALVVVGQAHADSYPPVAWYSNTYNSIVCESYQASQIQDCTVEAYNSTPDYIHSFDYWIHPLPHNYSPSTYNRGLTLKRIVASTGNPASNINVTIYVNWHCPSGGTINVSTGKCENAPPCPEGESRDAFGQCVAPPCEDGRELDSGFYSSANNPVACIQGCQALRVSTGAPVLNCDLSQGIGVCSYIYPARYVDTGVACSPSSEPPKEAPKPDCPQCDCIESGGAWGTVNGAPSCVPQGTPGSSPVTKPSRPPEVTTTTPAPTPENPNPEPVTEVTPAPVITVTPPPPGAPAGTQPTVTETTTDENGNTITTEKGKKGFCEENPAATICRDDDKSVWAGGCGSFHCEGDAVQCAISRKIHQDRCDDLEAIAQYGAAVENGGDLLGGVQQQDVQDFLNRTGPNHQTINLEGALNESGQYAFAAQCFDDLQVSAGIFNFTVPFSQLCGVFLAIGYALLAGAYLFAIRIVGII